MYLRKKNRINKINKQEPQIIEGFLGLGCMFSCSSAKAAVTQENNQTTINENDFKSTSEIINSMVSETLLTAANNCTAASYSSQVQNYKNIKTAKDFIAMGSQTTQAALSFSCVQASTIANASEASVMDEIMTNLINKSSTEALQKMDALAESKNKSGALSMGSATSASTTSQLNSLKTVNSSHTDIAAAVANSVVNNVKESSIQNCIASVSSDQTANFENLDVGGSAIIMFDQDIGSELTSKCMQESKMGNSVMNTLTSLLGIQVENTNNTSGNQSSKGKADAKDEQEGLGDVIKGIFDDFANMFGGYTRMIEIMVGAVVCFCCLSIVSCLFMFKG